MKSKSKIIIVVSLMLFSSFFIIPSTVTANTPAPSPYYTGLYNVTANVDWQNYSLPNYNYAQFNSLTLRGSNVFGNPPVFTRNNVFHQAGFVYLNTSNDLVFYQLSNGVIKHLANFASLSQSGRTFYGDREWLHYYQLPNGSLYDVWTVGQDGGAGNLQYDIYFFYNNTLFQMYANQGSFASGITFSTYQITNNSFWLGETVNSASGLGTDYVNYINWNGVIQANGKTSYGFSYYGLAVDDSNYNSAFAEVSADNNGSMMMQLWDGTTTFKQDFNIINITTQSVKWVNTSFTNSNINTGINNVPFSFMQYSNGTVLYYNYIMVGNTGSSPSASNPSVNTGLIEIYWNTSTESIISTNAVYYNNTYLGGNELLTNDPYISYSGYYNGYGWNYPYGETTISVQQPDFYNWFNSTRYITNTWIDSQMNNNNIIMQLADASVNDYASFVFTNPTSETGTNNAVTVYWMPSYTTQFYTYNNTIFPPQQKYNINITESGLPSGTSWSFIFNGTTTNLNTNQYNLSVNNGSYSFSIPSINGYTVSYPSSITVNGNSQTVNIIFKKIPTYKVELLENGLPSGTQWNYTFNHNSQVLGNSSYTYLLSNGTYSLYVGTVNLYSVKYSTSVIVSGYNQTVYINYSKIPTYSLIVKESGLSNNTKWYINLNSNQYSSTSNYNNISGLTNGTYSLSINNINGYQLGQYSSSILINGKNYYLNITFTANSKLYSVSIIASGVKDISSITWGLLFNNTDYYSQNSNTIIIPSLTNGTYSLLIDNINGYIIHAYSKSITISGKNLTEYITFNKTYTLFVKEFGYSGQWFIDFNGSSYSSLNNYLNITGLVNYSYSFSVPQVVGYSVSTYYKSITINGNNAYVNLTFTYQVFPSGKYEIIFVITGLPKDTNWSISINGIQHYSNGSNYINITLTNGTYYPQIILPNNYVLTHSPNTLQVVGSAEYYPLYANYSFNWQTYMPEIAIAILFIGVLLIPAVIRRS